MKIRDIIQNPTNPRIIKDDKFKKLVQSIKDFPEMLELRPIVIDENNMVLGGNMRLKACIEVGLTDVPTIQAKDLTEEQKKEFIIKDNVGFGEWNWDDLANEWNIEDLSNWGLDIPIEEQLDKLEDGEEIEFEKLLQIEPPKEYVLIMAEPNSIEWEEIKEKLKLKMVRRGGYKKGSCFDDLGIERVIEWSDFKERYVNSSTE